MFDTYNTVKTFKSGPFDIEVAWAYEQCSIRDLFDETEEEYARMEKRCQNYIDTHYMVRVQAMYDDNVLGKSYLGSCYASGCTPEDDIDNGIGGYLEDLVKEVTAEARAVISKLFKEVSND